MIQPQKRRWNSRGLKKPQKQTENNSLAPQTYLTDSSGFGSMQLETKNDSAKKQPFGKNQLLHTLCILEAIFYHFTGCG